MSAIAGRWRWLLVGLYVVAAIFVSWQQNHLGHIGNFITFQTAAERLPLGENLYGPINGKLDYLYSPTFAVLFAPFALPPRIIGLLLWNAVNAIVLLVAILRLLPERRTALIAALLVFPEVVKSLQNTQSNALVAGLVVLAFVAFEAERKAAAGLLVAAGAAIKIFPVAAAVFFVFREHRARWLLALAGSGLLVLLAPLLVTSPAQLVQQYQWWGQRTAADLALPGISVIGILHSWLGYTGPALAVELAGTVLVMAPLVLRRDRWPEAVFRRLFLCSLLVFMVIFNHNAESPSFVIAMTGIAVWYATERRTALHHVLIVLLLLVLWVASETIVPDYVRNEIVKAYALKAFVCLLCWIVMQRDLLRRPGPPSGPEPAHG